MNQQTNETSRKRMKKKREINIKKYKNSKRYDQRPIQCEFSELLRQPNTNMWIGFWLWSEFGMRDARFDLVHK